MFFCFFPYLDLFHLGTDTQPNAMVAGTLVLASLKDKRINAPIIALWLLFGISIIFAINSNLQLFVTVKTILNYMSPPIIAFAAYNIFIKLGYRVHFRFFLFVILSYLIVGLVQDNISPHFMSFLLNETRGVNLSGRGVISLTTEPAFYGSICLFLMIFSMIHYNYRENLITVPLLLFQLLFLAKTTTAIGLLGVAVGMFCLIQVFKFRLAYILLSVSVLIVGSISINKLIETYEDTRVGDLMGEFIKDPLMITQVDQSAAVRLTANFAPFIAIKENYFLPFGYGRYNQFVSGLYYQGKYRKLIPVFTLQHKDKIGGGLNVVLFHFGFLGLLFPWAIYASFKDKLQLDHYLFGFLLFLLLLFTVQLMHSMIGLIIGTALYFSRVESLTDDVNQLD